MHPRSTAARRRTRRRCRHPLPFVPPARRASRIIFLSCVVVTVSSPPFSSLIVPPNQLRCDSTPCSRGMLGSLDRVATIKTSTRNTTRNPETPTPHQKIGNHTYNKKLQSSADTPFGLHSQHVVHNAFRLLPSVPTAIIIRPAPSVPAKASGRDELSPCQSAPPFKFITPPNPTTHTKKSTKIPKQQKTRSHTHTRLHHHLLVQSPTPKTQRERGECSDYHFFLLPSEKGLAVISGLAKNAEEARHRRMGPHPPIDLRTATRTHTHKHRE